MWERLLFKKIEVWLVLLLVPLALVAAVFYGAAVRNVTQGNDRFGKAGDAAYAIASIPANARELWKSLNPGSGLWTTGSGDRFEGRTGWTFDAADPSNIPDGYLMLSRYDGNELRHTVELYDLKTGELGYSWPIDADKLLKDAPRISKLINFDRWNTPRFRAIHPLALESGDLIFKDHSAPLIRTTPCGDLVWRIDSSLYHHTTEMDAEGQLWVTNRFEPAYNPDLGDDFNDDGIVQVSPDGVILFERSLAEVFVKEGYDYLLYARGPYVDDPLHLNDVEPALEDGPFWKKGDLFLSIRNLSMVALYRPSTDEIIWMKQGPWAHQHDVDIIDENTIAVFDNNALNIGTERYVDGVSDVMFYDFDTDTIRSPYREVFEAHQIRSGSEGLFSLLPSGHLLVEEENSGRFLIFGPDGTLGAEYVNRGENGRIFRLGWSRFVDRQAGDRLLLTLESANCRQ